MQHPTEEMLVDYQEGALPLDVCTQVKDHLSGCQRCSSLLAGYSAVVGALRQTDSEVAEKSFTATVMSRISKSENRSYFEEFLSSIEQYFYLSLSALTVSLVLFILIPQRDDLSEELALADQVFLDSGLNYVNLSLSDDLFFDQDLI